MNPKFVAAFEAGRDKLRKSFAKSPPEDYGDLVKRVVMLWRDEMDPDRVHEIDDGHYQGTLLFVIGENGYQPSRYWYVLVDYGSCSGCDTLESIRMDHEPGSEASVNEYMQLALHIVQGVKPMFAEPSR